MTAIVGLVGALIGGVAVIASSWFQNRYDREQRERDRIMQLRRDVFLEAAEALSGYPQYLASIPNANLALESLAPMLNIKPGWETKIHLIASLPTIAAVTRVSSHFSTTLFQVAPARYRLDDLRRRISVEEERRVELGRFQAALHTSLQAHLGRSSEVNGLDITSESLRGELARVLNQIVGSHDSQAELHGEQARMIYELNRTVLGRIAELRLLVAEAVLATRKEIEAPNIEKGYRAVIESSNTEALAASSSFLASSEADV